MDPSWRHHFAAAPPGTLASRPPSSMLQYYPIPSYHQRPLPPLRPQPLLGFPPDLSFHREEEGFHKRMRFHEPECPYPPPNRVRLDEEPRPSLISDAYGRSPSVHDTHHSIVNQNYPSMGVVYGNSPNFSLPPLQEQRGFTRSEILNHEIWRYGADFRGDGPHTLQNYHPSSNPSASADRSWSPIPNIVSIRPHDNNYANDYGQFRRVSADSNCVMHDQRFHGNHAAHSVGGNFESAVMHRDSADGSHVLRPLIQDGIMQNHANHNTTRGPRFVHPLPPNFVLQKTNQNHPDMQASAASDNLFPVFSGSFTTSVTPPPNAHVHDPLPHLNEHNVTKAYFPPELYTQGHQAFMEQHNTDDPNKLTAISSLSAKDGVVDVSHLFRMPHRTSRPEHIVLLLRGLPGSGKSYIAKMLRDLELENGGNAPRIHSLDDYFMVEVEKNVEDSEASKSSSSFRGNKQLIKKVIEYCYEPEMEETYRSSMLKAFKKTVEESIFNFVIVDDRNLRVADFAQFWAIGKRSGYEVYLLEAPYKDPMGCAARNVHGFSLEKIQKMAEGWEEAPPQYLKVDVQSLFRVDDLNRLSIQEVDMEADEETRVESDHGNCNEDNISGIQPKSPEHKLFREEERWQFDEEELSGVKEIGRSKWSKDIDEDDAESDNALRSTKALSGLCQAYHPSEKSVHWGDKVERGGFSIAAAKKKFSSSLIIGPGSGYNLKSNPVVEDVTGANGLANMEAKKQFREKLRAERESFKAVFERRRQRIGGFDGTDD